MNYIPYSVMNFLKKLHSAAFVVRLENDAASRSNRSHIPYVYRYARFTFGNGRELKTVGFCFFLMFLRRERDGFARRGTLGGMRRISAAWTMRSDSVPDAQSARPSPSLFLARLPPLTYLCHRYAARPCAALTYRQHDK